MARYKNAGNYRTSAEFAEFLGGLASQLGFPDVEVIPVPVEDSILVKASSPLGKEIVIAGFRIGNRWVVHPMEGWDGNLNGSPSVAVMLRWMNMFRSGAKLIWGPEAIAIDHDARANPNQLVATDDNVDEIVRLLDYCKGLHAEIYGTADDLLVVIQLTDSGRFRQPTKKGRPEPVFAYSHPILDKRFGIQPGDTSLVVSTTWVKYLIERFVKTAARFIKRGYKWIDVKHCHGYLLHEFLGAFTRKDEFGGSFENRTRILREIVEGIKAEGGIPCMRLSLFDLVPFEMGEDGVGKPVEHSKLTPYQYGFGVDQDDPTKPNMAETIQLLHLAKELGIEIVNGSGGSPYYNPHCQRPAGTPPSDAYMPPEDPMLGVTRLLNACRIARQAVPGLPIIATGLSALRQHMVGVAQGLVRTESAEGTPVEPWADMVGFGRAVLAPAGREDVKLSLEQGELSKLFRCCEMSDCTTGPRKGLPSGCFPGDPYYKAHPEAKVVAGHRKAALKERAERQRGAKE